MGARRPRSLVLAALAAIACVACIPSFPATAGAAGCTTAATTGAAPGWQCTFDDEFTGTQLNGIKWLPQKTDGTGFTSGPNPKACYLGGSRNISVSGGSLNLTVRRESSPFTCKSPLGNFQTQYSSGMVSTSQGRFSQTFGRYEIRAKVPATTVKGLQSALWLWPANDTIYGAWPLSGEIDIAELFSGSLDRAIPYIHYATSSPDSSVTNENCLIDDPQNFHNYVLEWTSDRIKISYDGLTCLVHHYNPILPLLAPQPFDHPFYVALSQGLGIGDNAFDPAITPLPATTTVDYVRVYKAAGAPPPEDLDPPETEITDGPAARTNDTTPTFGFASPSPDASSFICRVDGVRAPCSGPGNTHTTGPLSEGDHHFTVAALDSSGNVDQSPAVQWFTVDTTPPDTTVNGPSGLINDSTPTFDFASPDPDTEAVICLVDDVVVDCSGPGASHTTSPLADGDHSFSVAARDAAGNVDPTPAARSFTVDATAPKTTLTGPSGLINDSTPTWSFGSVTGDAVRFICGLDGAVVPCSGPGDTHTTAPLPEGVHLFAVAAVDAQGNIDPSFEMRWIQVDTTPPDTTVSGPSGVIGDPTPTFQLSSPSSDANGVTCRVDDVVVACSGPGTSHTTSPLADGAHTFSAAARDVAGNVDPTPATQSFTVNAKAPTTTLSGPSGLTGDSTPTWSFGSVAGDAVQFICGLDGAVVPCSGPGNTHTTGVLADGLHMFAVAGVDAYGNVDPSVEFSWVQVDTTPPETVVSGPSGVISDSTPTFQISSPSSDASGVTCRVDDVVVACSGPGPSHTTSPLPDGDHSFSAAARDTVGNVDPTPASRSFTVDAIP
jgi:beta-glucanase (GH16 family)